jgi:hypothetical protein
MKIKRTKDTGFGWRRKFKLSKKGVFEIILERKIDNKWKEVQPTYMKGIWLAKEEVEILKEFLEENTK